MEINVCPPPWDAPGQKNIFLISFIYMEILVFKFERPISNNKENKMFAPLPDTPLTKINQYISMSISYNIRNILHNASWS